MKKNLSLLVVSAALIGATLTGCGGHETSYVEGVIEQAQKMSANELYAKAIEELDGKTLVGVGNSSRGKTAQAYFINYLKGLDAEGNVSEKIRKEFPGYKEDFKGAVDWTQPKSNGIFAQIDADVAGSNHQLSMTLIQDANQIDAKEVQTGNLLNYVPKEWEGDADNKQPFALQSLNKVFEFNNLDKTKTFKNCWDFVRTGETPMFMAPASEPVGRNFLIMLTNQKYSDILQSAAEAIGDATEKSRIKTVADGLEQKAKDMKLTHPSAKYGLAYIKLFIEQYNEQPDDGPICASLVKNSAAGQSGLLVYSKLRSISETDETSKKNITIAAYQDGYKGIGGYMYKHYLQVLKTSPLPWSSCAFIHFMTCTYDGFAAWGRDIGGYCSNNKAGVNQDHSADGKGTLATEKDANGVYAFTKDATKETVFPALNDKGYAWWTGTGDGKGNMVIEDGAYCAKMDITVGTWLDNLKA